jgi:hypothetical protein
MFPSQPGPNLNKNQVDPQKNMNNITNTTKPEKNFEVYAESHTSVASHTKLASNIPVVGHLYVSHGRDPRFNQASLKCSEADQESSHKILEDSDLSKRADSFLTTINQHIQNSDEVNIPPSNHSENGEKHSEIEYIDINKDKKRVWNEEDDKELLQLAVKYKHDWKKVGKRLSSTRKITKKLSFLRNRYQKIKEANPNIGTKYTPEEDAKLSELVQTIGLDWATISKEFTNRDACSVRNRYYYHLKDKIQIMNKDTEEIKQNSEVPSVEQQTDLSDKGNHIDRKIDGNHNEKSISGENSSKNGLSVNVHKSSEENALNLSHLEYFSEN